MNSDSKVVLEYPLNSKSVLEAIENALGEYFPDDPAYSVAEADDTWLISVFSNKRGGKSGGQVTLSSRNLDVLDVKLYQ